MCNASNKPTCSTNLNTVPNDSMTRCQWRKVHVNITDGTYRRRVLPDIWVVVHGQPCLLVSPPGQAQSIWGGYHNITRNITLTSHKYHKLLFSAYDRALTEYHILFQCLISLHNVNYNCPVNYLANSQY